ncbi:MAG: hypothetical protein HXO94_05655 [Streptococcus sp.]|jgi:hypothetical protein|uniref:Uncharacterized protein n=2 Tax=unclassified Caudoviricetes TaxID=2788787 RepID=A0A8S5N3X3_9CAUD|nr:hypothetical protein [Streptococcus sp.]DAD89140.1 MAG TPA: hypothetical protein [Siphoviridae sp. ctlSa24]DAE02671.1 MAG TPA: hypothetical protein [Siphoviridae sp. ct1C151]
MKIVLFLENGKAFEFKNIEDLEEYEKTIWFTYTDREDNTRMSAKFDKDRFIGISRGE